MRAFYITILLLLLAGGLVGQDEDPPTLLHTFYAYTDFRDLDGFGRSIATGDYNGDGNDDLLVELPWRKTLYGVPGWYGRIMMYWGTDTFISTQPDTLFYFNAPFPDSLVPDTSLPVGPRPQEVMNMGDVNGDGCDDIGVRVQYWADPPIYFESDELMILLGGTSPDSIRFFDFVPPPPYSTYGDGWVVDMKPLGDINNDGYDDVGYWTLRSYLEGSDIWDNHVNLYIGYGGPDSLRVELLLHQLVSRENAYAEDYTRFYGMADVNADGYNDFTLAYADVDDILHFWLYFGGAEVSNNNRMLLAEPISCANGIPPYGNTFIRGLDAGDWNNDGIEDFVGRNNCDRTDYRLYIFLGSPDIASTYDWNHPAFKVNMGACLGGWDDNVVFADFNNDGYMDYQGGNPSYLQMGEAVLYMGGPNHNTSIDYRWRWGGGYAFGMISQKGDFNHDGYPDMAFNAPGGTNASISIFAGGAYLYDRYTTAAEDLTQDEAPPVKPTVTAYPNPFNPTVSFTTSQTDLSDLYLRIYNIKGQVVDNVKMEHDTVSWTPKRPCSGVYLYRLCRGNKVLTTGKVTLLK